MNDSADFDPISASIELMRAQIGKLQSAIETLEGVRGVSGSAASTAVRSSSESYFSNDAFFGMTIAEGAKKYLTVMKKTAPAKTIAESLVAGGFKTSAKNFVETVRSILSRHQYFAFVNGEFGLADWYPGRKVATKTRVTSAGTGPEEQDGKQIDPEGPMAEDPAVKPL